MILIVLFGSIDCHTPRSIGRGKHLLELCIHHGSKVQLTACGLRPNDIISEIKKEAAHNFGVKT